MTRSLRILSLLLVTAFAMGAFLAPGAPAEGLFTAEEAGKAIGATTVQPLHEDREYFETLGRQLECQVTHFTGITQLESTELEITPNFTDITDGGVCIFWGDIFRLLVTENNCNFTFKNPETILEQTDYAVEMDLRCQGTQQFVMHAQNMAGEDVCTITIPPQTAQGEMTAVSSAGQIAFSGAYALKATMDSKSTLICGVLNGTSKEVTIYYVNNDSIALTSKANGLSISD